MKTSESLVQLFERYLNNECSIEEVNQLLQYFEAAESEEELRKIIQKDLCSDSVHTAPQHLLDENFKKIKLAIGPFEQRKTKSVPLIKKSFFYFSAAAALLFLVLLTIIFLSGNKKTTNAPFASKKVQAPKDIAPGNANATLTLADGKTIVLDNAVNGQLAVQGNIELVKLADGQIAYRAAGGETIKELEYNTLYNPRGSKVIDLILSDGSHVWLNSGSSITFPVAFIGKERKIIVDGEAYFEVTHDDSKPFIVKRGETSISVLGTRFNVNAYSDEQDINVTLLEGAVKICKGSHSALLKPEQQARITENIKVIDDIDVNEVMSWKNGIFLLCHVPNGIVLSPYKEHRCQKTDRQCRPHETGITKSETPCYCRIYQSICRKTMTRRQSMYHTTLNNSSPLSALKSSISPMYYHHEIILDLFVLT